MRNLIGYVAALVAAIAAWDLLGFGVESRLVCEVVLDRGLVEVQLDGARVARVECQYVFSEAALAEAVEECDQDLFHQPMTAGDVAFTGGTSCLIHRSWVLGRERGRVCPRFAALRVHAADADAVCIPSRVEPEGSRFRLVPLE